MQIRFDEFVFDDSARELSRSGQLVRLSPKAFEVLRTLLSAAPAAVSSEDLYRAIWGEVTVEEANLPNLISELRGALGDTPRASRFIRTVHRFGYRFTGERHRDRQRSLFALEWGSMQHTLAEGINVLGRSAEADVQVESAGVSRRHATITVTPAGAEIADCASKNGTYVGGERVSDAVGLSNGDVIRLGSASLTFRARTGDDPTVTEITDQSSLR